MLTLLISTILVILYCYYEGKREALFYQKPVVRVWGFDEHRIFFKVRLLFYLALFGLILPDNPTCRELLSVITAFVGLILIFPLFHDGFYYHFRNKYNSAVYPLGFRDNNDPTDSVKTFSADRDVRVILATIGFILIITAMVI